MVTQPFYGKGPHKLLRAGSRPARGTITIIGIPNGLIYSVIFIIHTLLKNVVVDWKTTA